MMSRMLRLMLVPSEQASEKKCLTNFCSIECERWPLRRRKPETDLYLFRWIREPMGKYMTIGKRNTFPYSIYTHVFKMSMIRRRKGACPNSNLIFVKLHDIILDLCQFGHHVTSINVYTLVCVSTLYSSRLVSGWLSINYYFYYYCYVDRKKILSVTWALRSFSFLLHCAGARVCLVCVVWAFQTRRGSRRQIIHL